jgi:hypothetical protein
MAQEGPSRPGEKPDVNQAGAGHRSERRIVNPNQGAEPLSYSPEETDCPPSPLAIYHPAPAKTAATSWTATLSHLFLAATTLVSASFAAAHAAIASSPSAGSSSRVRPKDKPASQPAVVVITGLNRAEAENLQNFLRRVGQVVDPVGTQHAGHARAHKQAHRDKAVHPKEQEQGSHAVDLVLAAPLTALALGGLALAMKSRSHMSISTKIKKTEPNGSVGEETITIRGGSSEMTDKGCEVLAQAFGLDAKTLWQHAEKARALALDV